MGNTPTISRSAQILGDLEFRNYMGIVRRRKLWILFPTLAGLILAAVVAWRLPNIYRCETIILVDPQKVPENYVRPATTSSIADRLSTIYEEVTSPARLKNLIDSLGLYPDLKKQVGEQEVIRIMKQAIGVEPVTRLGTQLSAFRITFKGSDPVEVTQVTNQIATMFIDANLKAREQQSYGTADFLEAELQKTAKDLQDKENELAQIRSRYIQDLPESSQFHVQEAENLRMQLRAIQEHISRDQQEKVYLQSLMATMPRTVDMDLGSNVSPYQAQIENLQAKLATLQARYGPDHPDVRKVEAQLAEAEAKRGETSVSTASMAAAARKTRNPVVESQIEKLDQDVEEQKQIAARLQGEIDFHVSKMERIPIFEQKTAAITRDYDTLKARYASMLDKKLMADTASAMESRQKAERFVILDPAQVPEKPYSPNRPLFLLAGLIGGLFAGIATALLKEVTDESIRDRFEAERILGKPVLSLVPEILSVGQQWRRRMALCVMSITTITVSVVLGLGLAHFSRRFF